MTRLPLFCFLTILIPVLACETPDFDDGIALYRSNQIEQARAVFAAVARREPDNPDNHVWLAESARRMRDTESAIAAARAALQLDDCHSFAHTVLGTSFTPHLPNGMNEPDSAWAHFQRAVECDPDDGNARIGIWPEALRRGERDVEDNAMRTLITSDFLTSAPLAFNRWVLRNVPDSAVLITSGDWDTFPALALQAHDSLRTDVAVININMLNLDWYVDAMSDRHDLPVLRTMPPPGTFGRNLAVIREWQSASSEGSFARAFTLSPSVSTEAVDTENGAWQDAGAYRRFVSDTTGLPPDTAAMRVALQNLDGAQWAGPETSPMDKSAVRVSANHQFPGYPIRTALTLAARWLDAPRGPGEAYDILDGIRDFTLAAGGSPSYIRAIDELQEKTLVCGVSC